ncbi:hypothetical protein KKG31_04170 [Patescibacteria group bacterium]|nr:hypothetical protein [Patescibacteria group bacterium]MBU1758338.1 hypothetical protein [Patescibacteria group bacterium]
MFKNIIKDSMKEMYNDVRIIRLTFFTTFFHSLIAILLIILNLNDLLARNYENGLYIGRVAEFFVQEVNRNHVVPIVITITIALFLMYSVIYPIGQSAIIHYLRDKKGIRSALKK